MDIDAALESNAQLAHAREPGMSALHHPAMSPEPVVALESFASDTSGDPSLFEMRAAALDVVGLVGMQFVRPASWASRLAGDRRQGLDQLLEDHRVMSVGSGDAERQGNAVAIGDQVPFAAELAAIGRVRPGISAPRGEATLAASRLVRLRSSLSARRSSASRT